MNGFVCWRRKAMQLRWTSSASDALCKSKVTDSVDDSKIDGFSLTTHIRRYLVRTAQSKNFHRRIGVNIKIVFKCFLHILVF